MITGKWKLLISNDLALDVGVGVVLLIVDINGSYSTIYIPNTTLYQSEDDLEKFIIGPKQ